MKFKWSIGAILVTFQYATAFDLWGTGIMNMYNDMEWGKRLTNKRILQKYTGSFLDCAEACMLFGSCQSFNYNRKSQGCELNYMTAAAAAREGLTDDTNSIYATASSVIRTVLGPVCSTTCAVGMGCDRSSKPPCVPSDCYEIPEKGQGTVIGSVRYVTCSSSTDVIIGDRHTICRADRTWSPVTYRCVAGLSFCAAPPSAIGTGSMTPSTGPYLEGDRVTYICPVGSVLNGTVDHVTCKADGSWTNPPDNCYEPVCTTTPPEKPGFDLQFPGLWLNALAKYTCNGEGYSTTSIEIYGHSRCYWSGWSSLQLSCDGCSVYGITYTKIPNARFFPPLSFQPAMGTTSPVTPAFFTGKCTGRTDFNCIAVSFEPRGDGGYGAFHEDGVFLDPDNKPYITYSRTFSIYIRNCL